jgi:hypothetical protein
MSTFADGAGIFFLLVIVLTLTVIVALCTLPFGLKKAAIAGVVTASICVAFGFCWHYQYLATSRANIDENGCVREVSPDDKYIARVCRMGSYDVLRLRAHQNTELLVERTYRYVDVPIRLYWEKDRLEYLDGSTGDIASIALPPSMIDHLLARVP